MTKPKTKNNVLYIFNLHFEIQSDLMIVQSIHNLRKKEKKTKHDKSHAKTNKLKC